MRAAPATAADGSLPTVAPGPEIGQRQTAVVSSQSTQPGNVARHSHRAAAEVKALCGRAEVDDHRLKVEWVRSPTAAEPPGAEPRQLGRLAAAQGDVP